MSTDLVVNAIAEALAVGALAGATDAAKKAIADGYDGLKSLLKKKFGAESEPVAALSKLEAKPDSEGRKLTLSEELDSAGAASDGELIAAAQALLELIRALPQGEKNIQVAIGQGIAQASHGSTASVTITKGYPPQK